MLSDILFLNYDFPYLNSKLYLMSKGVITFCLLLLLVSCVKKHKSTNQTNYKTLCNATVYDFYNDATQSILFYPNDSVIHFQPNLVGYDSIKVAINCLNIYDKNCWKTYQNKEIKLKNRSNEPNGWADGPFTNYIPEYLYDFIDIDIKAPRNNLEKLNVIRFKLYNDSVIYEKVYHIGVGIKKPQGAIAIIDYEDLNQMVGPNGNYANGSGFKGRCDLLDRDVVVGANYIVPVSYTHLTLPTKPSV